MNLYAYKILLSLDQLLNTLLGGYPDDTLSARAWANRRHRVWAIAVVIIDTIFAAIGYPNHCKDAYDEEVNRSQSEIERGH
jgi:hypothetical protein